LAVDATVDLWALDEVHFQQHGSRCQMWIPPEIRDPICLHHPTRKSVGFFGAVRLSDGKLIVRREEEKFNAQTFWDFLKELEAGSRRTGRKIVVISDNAKYHHANLHKPWREAHQQAFALDYLPPYSPDLNPIERVWKLTRRSCLHNRYFAKLETVVDVVERQFQHWAAPNEILRKLCAIL
jgi:transposase